MLFAVRIQKPAMSKAGRQQESPQIVAGEGGSIGRQMAVGRPEHG